MMITLIVEKTHANQHLHYTLKTKNIFNRYPKCCAKAKLCLL